MSLLDLPTGELAHRMWEAFSAAHSQAAHAIGALISDDCEDCAKAMYWEGEPCRSWQEWQAKVTDGFGSV